MTYTKTAKQKMAEFDQGYNIAVTGRHVHVTEAMENYAIEKLSKLERIGDRIIDITVTMDIQKIDNKVDIVLKYGHTLIKSHGSSTDMYASIDKAVDKLQVQLKKYKTRLKDHHAKAHPIEEMAVTVYSPEVWTIDEEEVNKQIDAANHLSHVKNFEPHKIVRHEKQALKILTDEEAIMKMELSLQACIVYRSEQSRKMRVLYRLEDGNYGVVEPV
jgi:putative sigma-54 modulation protein